LVTALECAGAPLTRASVTQRLLHEGNVRRELQAAAVPSSGDAALWTAARPPARMLGTRPGPGERGGFSGTCHYCGKPGHKQYDCRKRKADEERAQRGNVAALASALQAAGFGRTAERDRATALAVRTSGGAAPSRSSQETPDAGPFLFMARQTEARRGEWIVDSGASAHMCAEASLFKTYRALDPTDVTIGDGSTIKAVGVGVVPLTLKVDGTPVQAELQQVLHVPDLVANLFSVPKATQQGYKATFKADAFFLKTSEGVVALHAVREGNMYKLQLWPLPSPQERGAASLGHERAHAAQASVTLDIWHQRLGHVAPSAIKQLKAQDMATGLEQYTPGSTDTVEFCEACALGKQHKAPIRADGEATRGARPLALVHTDVVGPMPTVSLGGSRYLLCLVDDKTRKTWMIPMASKSDTAAMFKQFKTQAEKQTGEQVKAVRSDNGGEYLSREFKDYLAEQGIVHQLSAPYTPQQNGVAERTNRTVIEMARSLLHHARLPPEFWAEAVATAVYVKNRCPHKATEGNKTPEEAYSGSKPDLAHLRVFGCDAYVLTQDGDRRKMDPKSRRCVFIGYTAVPGTYRLFDPSTRKVIISRDVLFNETAFSGLGTQEDTHRTQGKALGTQQEPVSAETQTLGIVPDTDAARAETTSEPEGNSASDGDSNDDEPAGPAPEVPSPAERAPRPESRYPRRQHRQPGEWWKVQPRPTSPLRQQAMLVHGAVPEPTTLREALSSDDAREWQAAVDDELAAIRENNVYEVTDLPPDRKVIKSRFVFKVKYRADGAVDRYKARLVAKGYTQQAGVDYEETFAPVAKFATIRTVLAAAAAHDLAVHQMDVKTAFLHGELDEEVYLEPPEGVPIEQGKVWRLRKALYGLKQAPRQWNRKLDEFLRSLGFQRSEADHSLYVHGDPATGESAYVVIAVYVDDLIIAGAERDVLDSKSKLASRFKMTDMGEVQWLLGLEVQHDKERKLFKLSQRKYIESVLERFGMADSKPVKTPMEQSVRLTADMSPGDDRERATMAAVPYRSAVGSLMYAMVATRPDIAAAVGAVSRFAENPGHQHWLAVKRIMRYLRGTSDWALHVGGTGAGGVTLQGYSDADWAGDLDTRRSTTGYVFTLGSGSIAWASKRQATVAQSTTEAEYMAVSSAAREAMWLRQLMTDLRMPVQLPITLYSDNQGGIALTKNPVLHQRTKHVDIKHHYIRELVEAGTVNLAYVSTADMVADVLTKALPREKHEQCCRGLGVRP
jgi:transposase InsO family protein